MSDDVLIPEYLDSAAGALEAVLNVNHPEHTFIASVGKLDGDDGVSDGAVAFQTTRFKCPFCPKSYSKRPAAEKHIERCWRNPEVRACKACRFFVQDEGDPETGVPPYEYCNADADHDIQEGLRTNCESFAATPDKDTEGTEDA